MTLFRKLIARELRLALRHGADTFGAILFFVLVIALFPLGIGPEPNTLARIAPGIIWVAALLAAILPLDRLFGADFEDGSLDPLMLSGLPPAAIAIAQAAAHWLTTGIMLRLDPAILPALLLGLLPGTLSLSLLGTFGSAMILGARRGGILLPLLVLPLAMPVLIFGTSAADAANTGLPPTPHLLLEAALLALFLPLCPLAAGAALRSATE